MQFYENRIASGNVKDFSAENDCLFLLDRYAKYFGKPTRKVAFDIQTPFVINYQKLSNLSDLDSSLNFMIADDHSRVSEFLFYSFLYDEPLVSTGRTGYTFWYQNSTKNLYSQFRHLLRDNQIRTMGFHRFFLQKLNLAEFDVINSFISSLGLEFKFKQDVNIPNTN